MPIALQSIIGVVALLAIAWLCSYNRSKINWRIVLVGLALHTGFCLLFSQVPPARMALDSIGVGFVKLLSFAGDGARFIFGDLANPGGKLAFIFAFNVLPILLFFSAFSALLYHFGILQKIVVGFAWIMKRTMQLSGPESLSVAGNIFLGQTEAPLLVRPFVARMTRSELFCLMVGGMSTLAGSVMAAYVAFLGGADPAAQAKFATWLLLASIMNAPAAVIFAKMILPEEDESHMSSNRLDYDHGQHGHFINALVDGTIEGLKLACIVAAVLLVFVSLIAFLNHMTQNVVGEWLGVNGVIRDATGGLFPGLTLQYLFGQLFRPVAWLLGVPWAETMQVGSLLGQKIVVNEFVAYLDLARLKDAGQLSPHSIMIATFALSSFSNFSSVGICVAGIGAMAPNQQQTLAAIGMRALLAAVLAGLLTATVGALWLTGT
ncbi:NupC/NupG family nucleoside CNT transporter [Chitinimonas sp. BJYL2]|uniref:NupC/NupG family nucleoside CNT transporter n=1 Tax=Chitinimonas sp. BJYL2 TaxID=2976696 RepID=UPI0022B5B941|nr:nucleoside transporter C-terminal domain-containing protein [Chitinimonas sp. BJYL2]